MHWVWSAALQVSKRTKSNTELYLGVFCFLLHGDCRCMPPHPAVCGFGIFELRPHTCLESVLAIEPSSWHNNLKVLKETLTFTSGIRVRAQSWLTCIKPLNLIPSNTKTHTHWGARGAGQFVASGMAQWIKVLVSKPNDLSLIPRTYMVEKESEFPQVVLWLP